MKIESVKIDGILGLKMIKMDGLGNVVKLLGRNGAGKSRVITSLLAVLQYNALPLEKRGELLKSTGGIEVELNGPVETDNWKIERTFKDGKTSLKITNKNVKGTFNQSTIDEFIGQNFVDLGKFLELPKEKVEEQVLKVLGLLEPLQKLDADYKVLETARRDVGRDMKSVGFNPDASKPEKVKAVSLNDLSLELQKANENNDRLKELKETREKATKRIDEILEQMHLLQKESDELKNTLANVDFSLLPMSEIPLEPIQNKVTNAEEINRKAQTFTQWEEKSLKYFELDVIYKASSAELENIKVEKAELIQSKPFPVAGLSYDPEQGLLFNGFPWISDGQKRTIAFQIAKALKGDLGIGTFENFSLLDPQNQASIIKEAEEAGFQCFIEIIAGSADGVEDGFYIEEGEVNHPYLKEGA